ncbi:GNAT family N-acetyltransferase [Actinocorallia longicatena]|uniref:GNAT family N-acetyltransferase n=1 Tax=Actinocorallia longicatena TaxID=111803 RepID=A0ABP6QLE3_9ACTN
MNATRPICPDDAPALAALLRANRDFLAPWEPIRPDVYFTPEGQRAVIEDDLSRLARGDALPHVILDAAGAPIGRITLSGIVRGAFQSGSLGYWLSAPANGKGHATRAVEHIIALAFSALNLHRIQAETLPHNTRSQRVLERTGFTPYGRAPAYLNIAGTWQDHTLYQLLNPIWHP